MAVGFVWPDVAVKLKLLGDSFIKLIKMIIPSLFSVWWCMAFP